MLQKLLTILMIICLTVVTGATAQTLEEVNFGTGTNTYVKGINNRGYICGYYDSAGGTMGFVINPDGEIARTPYTTAYSVKFEKINDHNVIAACKITGGTNEVYKVYYDTVTRGIPGGLVAVPGNMQPGIAIPYGINNNNDISGWYQGASYRFLWVLHDSLTTTPQWTFDKYLTYNTMGTAVNDAGTSTGFYINGSNYGPFLYDVAANSFTILNTAFHMKPWGINNNNVICGEYWQTSGYYTAFWGPVVSGIVQTHAMSSLWQNPLTQSVANGINDKNEIVGCYVHPTTGNWVGFIYRPNTNEYRLPGYDWNRHTYSMVNSTTALAGHQPVWSTNYYGGFDYYTTDPYANNGTPVISSLILNANQWATNHATSPNFTCVDYKSIATEMDTFHIGTDPSKLAQYLTIWKPWAFNKWVGYTKKIVFPGICYGFAFSSLIKYADSNMYQSWFGIPATTNLYSLQNTNSAAVTAIARTFIKQNDKSIMPPFGTSPAKMMSVLPWSGLYRLKNCYQDNVASRRNPRAIFINEAKAGGGIGCHSILPFKIHTPQKFPFNDGGVMSYDTLFVYDSNYPMDSTNKNRFIIKSDMLYAPIDSVQSTGHNVKQIAFNEAGIKEISKIEHGQLKGTGIGVEEPYITSTIGWNAYYNVIGAGGTQAAYTGATATNNIPYFIEMTQKDTGYTPSTYALDTLQQVAFSSTHYLDSVMAWDLTNNHRNMGINRINALPNEHDNSTIGNHIMTYGTHDAVTKNLNAHFVEMNDDVTQGVNIMATNLMVNNGDSIVTSNPSKYVYKITRISNTSDPYDLWIFVAGADDSVRQVRVNNVPMGPNTTHTIDVYAGGPNGTQIKIEIDKGNNGSVDSTINLTTSLGIGEMKLPAGYVRLYPNPASKEIGLAFNGDIPKNCTILINDMAGRALIKKEAEANHGAKEIHVAVDNLPTGAYIVHLVNEVGAVIFSDKLIKE